MRDYSEEHEDAGQLRCLRAEYDVPGDNTVTENQSEAR